MFIKNVMNIRLTEYPTKFSGEIILTNGKPDFIPSYEASAVFPLPYAPDNRKEIN